MVVRDLQFVAFFLQPAAASREDLARGEMKERKDAKEKERQRTVAGKSRSGVGCFEMPLRWVVVGIFEPMCVSTEPARPFACFIDRFKSPKIWCSSFQECSSHMQLLHTQRGRKLDLALERKASAKRAEIRSFLSGIGECTGE